MNSKIDIDLYTLDELAYTITDRHGKVLGSQPGLATKETYVYSDTVEDGQELLLLFSSLRNWYLQSDGGRKTRSGQDAFRQNYVRTESGMFVVSDYIYDHLGRPLPPSRMKNFEPKPGEKRSGYHAGPRSLKRAYFLLDAMAIELGE